LGLDFYCGGICHSHNGSNTTSDGSLVRSRWWCACLPLEWVTTTCTCDLWYMLEAIQNG
jgi:hypothetical protein